jgi:hypothetical protein
VASGLVRAVEPGRREDAGRAERARAIEAGHGRGRAASRDGVMPGSPVGWTAGRKRPGRNGDWPHAA